MAWQGRRGRRERRGWEEDLLREIRALQTTEQEPDGTDVQPLRPIRRTDRRPRRTRRTRVPLLGATRGATRAGRGPRLGGAPHRAGERRRTVITVVVTVVVVALLATASFGPVAPAVRRLIGLGPHGGADGHAYAFIRYDGYGNPVGFSTCHPIHFEVNHDQAPADWPELIDRSVAAVSRATGLQFVDDGSTHDTDYFDRRQRLTGAAEPVLIGWTTSDRVHDLDGDVAGVTSSDYNPQTRHYDTGRVVLDADAFAELDRTRGITGLPGGGDQVEAEQQAIVMHELGHLVGLGHVDDPAELMYPTAGAQLTYGPGDLAGLRELGRLGC